MSRENEQKKMKSLAAEFVRVQRGYKKPGAQDAQSDFEDEKNNKREGKRP